jgi:enoyl-CoA hydratase/carnithine racemase
MPGEYTTIRHELADSILTITLDRPKVLNALNTTMKDELLDSIERADRDDAVRVVVVTGAGRGFCSGLELSSGDSPFGEAVDAVAPEDFRDLGGQIALAIFRCRKPWIAAVNGPAAGFGATVTLPMDFRIASSAARFGFVFTRRGVVLEACSSWFLPRVVGMPQALEWTITGRLFGADEALRGGLVRGVHAPEELLPAAYELAGEIATATSPVAVAVSRRMLWAMEAPADPSAAHVLESRIGAVLSRSADSAEGGRAFMEKRPPRFTMSVNADFDRILPADIS